MIKLQECEAINVLPLALRKDEYIQAESYALKETAKMLMEKLDRVSVYAGMDFLPDRIVDLLAKELRAQYYDASLAVEDKRAAVKKALLWHCKAGTVAAVKELTNLVWRSESAKVQEWFEYGSEAYLFRILLGTDMTIEEERIDAFLDALWKVKNTRSHLESIAFMRRFDALLYIGAAARSWGNLIIMDTWKDEYDMHTSVYVQNRRAEIKRIQIKEG